MERINVILIAVDSLRADHLGCYGYTRNTSPNIDAFSQECVLFEEAISQATWTAPSVTSILTSLYPTVHGIMSQHKLGRLNENKTSLASHLRRAGYATAAFAGGGYVSEQLGLDQGFDVFSNRKYNLHEWEIGQGGRLRYESREFFRWLRHSVSSQNRAFFAYLHCWDIHEPFIAHPKTMAQFNDNYKGPLRKLNNTIAFLMSNYFWKFRCRNLNAFYLSVINRNRISLTDEDIRYIRALYDNEIRFLDNEFGRFVSKLGREGLLDNTLIIVTADHGQELLERRGRLGHGGPGYETLAHVPLLIRLPGGRSAGTRVQQQVQSVDISATVLDLTEIDPVVRPQGKSLLPLLNGTEPDAESLPAYSMDVATKTIRWNGYKLITRSPEPLNNQASILLHTDPDESATVLIVTGGMRINVVDFERHRGSNLQFQVEVRDSHGNSVATLAIAHTDSVRKVAATDKWQRFETPPFEVPAKMPNNMFQCQLVCDEGTSSLVIKNCRLVNLSTGELLFSYHFDQMNDPLDLYRPIELYHLVTDVSEQRNIVTEKPEIADALYSKLRDRLEEDEERSQTYGDNTDAEIDRDFRRRLRQLGYLD